MSYGAERSPPKGRHALDREQKNRTTTNSQSLTAHTPGRGPTPGYTHPQWAPVGNGMTHPGLAEGGYQIKIVQPTHTPHTHFGCEGHDETQHVVTVSKCCAMTGPSIRTWQRPPPPRVCATRAPVFNVHRGSCLTAPFFYAVDTVPPSQGPYVPFSGPGPRPRKVTYVVAVPLYKGACAKNGMAAWPPSHSFKPRSFISVNQANPSQSRTILESRSCILNPD